MNIHKNPRMKRKGVNFLVLVCQKVIRVRFHRRLLITVSEQKYSGAKLRGKKYSRSARVDKNEYLYSGSEIIRKCLSVLQSENGRSFSSNGSFNLL